MNVIRTKVVGVSYDGRQAHVKNLSIGTPLILVREPDNQYDQNAIRITTIEGMELGFVKAGLAAELAPLLDRGTKFICKVLEVTGGGNRNYGCNIVIKKGQ